MEWPSRCRYWQQPKVKALLDIVELGWKDMRVKACAHGQRLLTGKDKGKALTKVWRLVSTIHDIQSAMDIPCQGDHDHVTTIGGSRALLSGKYPDGFAKAFHQHSRNVVLNNDKSYTTCVIDLKTTSQQLSNSESLQWGNGTTIQNVFNHMYHRNSGYDPIWCGQFSWQSYQQCSGFNGHRHICQQPRL